MNYSKWFEKTNNFTPHPWQVELGQAPDLVNRLLRFPTGLGKTLGIASAWYFNTIEKPSAKWPRRLVWCLPSRVLVEQTANELRKLFTTACEASGARPLDVHVLMGGEESSPWHLSPSAPCALVGTQDMLLSRVLGRGYASARARWPIEYGLLNQDCLWVIDEVQLHGVGLATSVQLEMFRGDDADEQKLLRPSATWWMSATLQPSWLETVDSASRLCDLRDNMLQVQPQVRKAGAWKIRKPLQCGQAGRFCQAMGPGYQQCTCESVS